MLRTRKITCLILLEILKGMKDETECMAVA